MINFTFSNPVIRDYFETGNNPPTSELMYLHEHPLVKPNFINQLETQMSQIGSEVQKRGITGKFIDDLIEIAVKVGTLLPTLSKDNAGEVLKELKKAYDMGKQLGVKVE